MFDKLYRQATDDVPLNAGLLAELKEQARQLDEQKPVNSVKKPVSMYRRLAERLCVVSIKALL